MTVADAKHVNHLIINEAWVEAANFALALMGKPEVTNRAQAVKVMQKLFQYFVDTDQYLHAATIQWGPHMFNTEPESTRRAFDAMNDSARILLMGASSMSKTYAAGGWMLIDYLRDPLYTTVKLAAVNEDHLKKNLFAHVVTLYRACAIPSTYDITIQDSALWMGVKTAGNEFGISGIAFKQSQTTSGQFKGYKSKPVRRVSHPKFGYMGRLRVLGDEGQNWPGGPFKDFNSLVASISGTDLVKVAVAFNPEDTSQEVVRMAEPEQGFVVDELDTLYDYVSKAGWRVCRLDAAKCENVIQKKIVYPGLQTYEGFLSYLKAGGDNSPNYFCFARGFPPMAGNVNTVIPPSWPQSQRGEATFIDNPTLFAGIDLAFMGKDSAQMAYGRWGLASGWRDHQGNFHTFKDRLDVSKAKPRHVAQIDALLPLAKHDDTVKMAEEIMAKCRMLRIMPENVAVDKTGYGFGTWSHLTKVWGEVLGVSWNEGSTERKILSEDLAGADEQCEGVMSEMWWAFRRWLDPTCCAVLINPIIPTQPIHTQLTSRRYENGKKGIKVEAKEKYMARNGGNSPDEADAMMQLIHIIRSKADTLPGLTEAPAKQKEHEGAGLKLAKIGSMASVDGDDSISEQGDDDY